MERVPNPLIENIIETLRAEIISGIHKPNSKLSENRIAQRFSCSRTPVREAFKRLEALGMIEIIPHSGSYVKLLSNEENIELLEIRSHLETLAFRLAAIREADVTELERLNAIMENALCSVPINLALFDEAHIAFHKELVRASGNKELAKIFDEINLSRSPNFFSFQMSIDEIGKTSEEHRRIISYLKERNVEEGSNFMEHHLWEKRNRILNSTL